MMFLDAWVIALSVYEVLYLPYLISVFFEIFKKKKFKFVLKIIYLSIHFSHVGLDVTLDYDNINTILLFQKKFSTFFPFGVVPLVFLKGKRVTIFYFFPFLLFIY